MATFQVDDVEKNSLPLPETDVVNTVTERSGKVRPEAWSKPTRRPVDEKDSTWINGFVSAVHTAYAQHYPLELGPDAVWMCIAQGLAHHVNQNVEKLRKMFVEHEGKKQLVVQRDDFIKGSPDNAWPDVFDSFSEQIRQYVGQKTHDLLTPEFSTTGRVERAAAQVVLMDTLKAYFSFMCKTSCGIPEITLRGTVEDWERLRDKALELSQYNLKWWIDELEPVLDQFVAAASGDVDQEFWSGIYKQCGGSGGPYVSGWIITLFPYLTNGDSMFVNRFMGRWESWGHVSTDLIPSGVTSTPFKWDYYSTVLPMRFHAGFLTVTQDQHTLAVQPEIGWAVSDDKQPE